MHEQLDTSNEVGALIECGVCGKEGVLAITADGKNICRACFGPRASHAASFADIEPKFATGTIVKIQLPPDGFTGLRAWADFMVVVAINGLKFRNPTHDWVYQINRVVKVGSNVSGVRYEPAGYPVNWIPQHDLLLMQEEFQKGGVT